MKGGTMATSEKVLRFLAAATAKVLKVMWHSDRQWGWKILNNKWSETKPDSSSIVIACIGWIQRNFNEAPPILEKWDDDRETWRPIRRHEVLRLLERPNAFYNGSTLMKAVIADRYLNGTGYIGIVRSLTLKPVQLWWMPASMIEPVGDENDPTVFIDHYEYLPPGASKPYLIMVEDIIRFPDGMDPLNPRVGVSKMKSLMREVYTDEEAAQMTAILLHNLGVPGIIISPEGSASIKEDVAKQLKARFMENFGGDKRGEPMVTGGATKVHQFGFSPEQMQMRALRGIPEERITAVIGVNAAVVGLGAGLATTKVGATLREYREEAFESTIIPLYRDFRLELTQQLLPEFISRATEQYRLSYDLSEVRVLQDDMNAKAKTAGTLVDAGIAMVSDGRRMTGLQAGPEHDYYLRRKTVIAVPADNQSDPPTVASDSNDDLQEIDDVLARRISSGSITSHNGH